MKTGFVFLFLVVPFVALEATAGNWKARLNWELGGMIRRGDCGGALVRVNGGLANAPRNGRLLGRKIAALIGLRRYEEALAVTRFKLEIDPEDFIGMKYEAQLLILTGHADEALAAAQLAYRRTHHVVFLGLMAEALFELERFEEARHVASLVLERSPENEVVQRLMARLPELDGQGEPGDSDAREDAPGPELQVAGAE